MFLSKYERNLVKHANIYRCKRPFDRFIRVMLGVGSWYSISRLYRHRNYKEKRKSIRKTPCHSDRTGMLIFTVFTPLDIYWSKNVDCPFAKHISYSITPIMFWSLFCFAILPPPKLCQFFSTIFLPHFNRLSLV